MKHTAYLSIIIILSVLSAALIFQVRDLNRHISFISDNASYWKHKYDSIAPKADSFTHLVFGVRFLRDSGFLWKGYSPPGRLGQITYEKSFYKYDAFPVRHSRHRYDKARVWHWKHEDEDNSINFPDYIAPNDYYKDIIEDQKGADGMPRNDYDTSVQAARSIYFDVYGDPIHGHINGNVSVSDTAQLLKQFNKMFKEYWLVKLSDTLFIYVRDTTIHNH